MKKAISKALIIFLFPFAANSQESVKSRPTTKNTFYLEIFGQGLYNSFNYDRLYNNTDKKIKNSFSAGLTLIPHPDLFVAAIPVSWNYILGQKNHHLELGIGFTAMYLRKGRINSSESYYDNNGLLITNDFTGHSNHFYTYFTPKLGYRFQKPEGGIFFRLTCTPPFAGINRIGSTKGGQMNYDFTNTEYFTNAAFFPSRFFPWAGISAGWTLKR